MINLTAKEYLGRAYRLDRRIDSKLMVLSRLRALAEKTTGVLRKTVVSRSQNEHEMEDTVAGIVDMEKEINEDIDRLATIKEEITQAIREIENPDYQTVLELRYLCYMSWGEIAMMMHYTNDYIFKLHRRALRAVRIPKEETSNPGL